MGTPLVGCDVAVVGGSTAGLSAALTLGRARRRVLVIDSGTPRNAPAAHAHNFFTRDGTPPSDLLRIGRAQLEPYGVIVETGRVVEARRRDATFELILSDGLRVHALKVILATGVADDLPDLRNLRELWGKSVFTCPYCHGWEVRDMPLAVVGSGEVGYEYALMIYNWSHDLTLCSDGPAELTPEQRDYLNALAIRVIETPLAGFELGVAGELEALVFADGQTLARHAVFMHPPVRLRAELATQLGCALSEDGNRITVDDFGQTTIPGVYAAGDAVTPFHAVARAAADGSKAAAMLNRTLTQEYHRQQRDVLVGTRATA